MSSSPTLSLLLPNSPTPPASPSPTPSSPRGHTQYDQGTITIPTSTVLSIGLGFLVFSFCILLILLLFRLNRIRKSSITQNKTFKECWRDEGGFWGFLTSFGDLNGTNHSSMIGATGRTLNYDLTSNRRAIMELLNSDEDEEKELIKLRNKPVLWDCSWFNGEKGLYHGKEGRIEADYEEDDTVQPLSIIPSLTPSSTKIPAPLPKLNLCVLISFPYEIPYNPLSEELPELLIGSTTLLPTVTISPSQITREVQVHEFDSSPRISTTSYKGDINLEKHDLVKEVEIEQLEFAEIPNTTQGYQEDGSEVIRKRAEWKLDNKGVWYIDGLDMN